MSWVRAFGDLPPSLIRLTRILHPYSWLVRITVCARGLVEQEVGRDENRLALALTQSAGGDSTAFADLVREHQGMVFSIAYHYLQDRSLAEDLAQEVFLELYQSLAKIQSPAHLT